ncbi:MAG TPA: hypothetical protein VMJ64_03495 [Anaerolineales bacterium]|nr:hypothetical protein [Anaerolineales bacterium]
MFPILLIAIGAAVLALGKRLAVLGAAVGALFGLALISLLPGLGGPVFKLAIPLVLAVLGFFFAGFAKGIVDIVLLVLGVLAGAGIVVGFLNLFNADAGLLGWILAIIGGGVGLVLVRRFKDMAMVVLAGLIGGLLVTRGLATWLPFLQGGLGTLLVIALAAAGIAYQGGLVSGRKAAAKTG